MKTIQELVAEGILTEYFEDEHIRQFKDGIRRTIYLKKKRMILTGEPGETFDELMMQVEQQ